MCFSKNSKILLYNFIILVKFKCMHSPPPPLLYNHFPPPFIKQNLLLSVICYIWTILRFPICMSLFMDFILNSSFFSFFTSILLYNLNFKINHSSYTHTQKHTQTKTAGLSIRMKPNLCIN